MRFALLYTHDSRLCVAQNCLIFMLSGISSTFLPFFPIFFRVTLTFFEYLLCSIYLLSVVSHFALLFRMELSFQLTWGVAKVQITIYSLFFTIFKAIYVIFICFSHFLCLLFVLSVYIFSFLFSFKNIEFKKLKLK